jgi:polysaccharide export outer membrane protein
VWNEESLTRDVVVSPDGFISFPLAGQIQAGGKTSAELEGALAAALGKYLKDEPTVTASLIQLEGNIVYVLGKVNRPGPYPINRPTDVTQALAMAGGLNQFAAENSINILRRDEQGRQHAIEFEYGDVKDGDALETNILLKAGDVVVVP